MIKFVIIVTFEPVMSRLLRVVHTALKQDFNVLVVDNSEKNPLQNVFQNDNVFLISLNNNRGIAYAQNIGVDFCESKGANIITFLDQDSLITENMLLLLEETVTCNYNCVACPVSIDEVKGTEYPSHRINKYGLMKNIFSQNVNTLVEVDIAISSGMTMSIQTFNLIGYFDEDFFIDFVDIDWCLRARKILVKILVVPDSVMLHRIGEKTVSFGFLNFNQHAPIRTYYKVRNSFILLRKKYNIVFCLRQIISAVVHNFIIIFIFKENEYIYLKFYIKGLYDGIRGKTGKLVNKNGV